MKTAVRLSLGLMVGVVFLAVGLRAAEDNYPAGMTEKFARGITNAATGWMELPMQAKKGYVRGVPCFEPCNCAASRTLGGLQGVCRGVSHTLGRTAWGVWELATFWAPNPTTNADVLLLQDGFYAWQEGTLKPFRCPTAKDGFRRIGMRIERGFNDFAGGIMEVPGQMKKAGKDCNFLPGLPKGLYYMVGRMVSGAGDLVLFSLPSPVDNLMVPFDEVLPWDAWEGNYNNNIAPAAAK